MIKLVIILLSALFLVSWKYEDKFEPDQVIVATFQNFTNCSKCYMQVDNQLDKISSSLLNKAKVVAFVECNRKRELEVYRKVTGWKYDMEIDRDDLKSELGLNFKTLLVLMKGDGTIIKSYDETNMHKAADELSGFLKSSS